MRAPEPAQIEAMTQSEKPTDQIPRPNNLNAQELRQLLVERLTMPKLGLTWARDALGCEFGWVDPTSTLKWMAASRAASSWREPQGAM